MRLVGHQVSNLYKDYTWLAAVDPRARWGTLHEIVVIRFALCLPGGPMQGGEGHEIGPKCQPLARNCRHSFCLVSALVDQCRVARAMRLAHSASLLHQIVVSLSAWCLPWWTYAGWRLLRNWLILPGASCTNMLSLFSFCVLP
jgi:hypothetical protein